MPVPKKPDPKAVREADALKVALDTYREALVLVGELSGALVRSHDQMLMGELHHPETIALAEARDKLRDLHAWIDALSDAYERTYVR